MSETTYFFSYEKKEIIRIAATILSYLKYSYSKLNYMILLSRAVPLKENNHPNYFKKLTLWQLLPKRE